MDAPLFRIQAIDARRQRAVGTPFESPTLASGILAAAAVAIVVGVGWLVWVVELPHRATVRGYLAPDPGLVRVRSVAAGTIAEVLVREGDEVAAGQALLRLETRRSTPSTPDIGAATIENLGRLRAATLTQRQLAQASLEAGQTELARRGDGLRREISVLGSQLEAARGRAGVAARRSDELAPATSQGLLPMAALRQQRDLVEELRLDALRIEQQLLERSRLLADVDAERSARGRQAQAQLAELDAALERLALETLEADQRKDALVLAPIASRVLRIAATVGAAMHTGETLLVLAPVEAALQAILMVPTRDAGMLVRGQPVVLRLDAFPHQRFGVRRATVLKVGAGVILPGEREAPVVLAEPAFEVVARLDSSEIAAYGRRWPLRTDLTFEADVQLDRSTLIDRLLDPLRAFARRDG